MKILITGSSGFIGQFLSRALLSKGHQVVGLDAKPLNWKEKGYQAVSGNVLNPTHIMKAATGADIIIHLAAKHHDFGISRADFFRVNLQGTQNLLDCAERLHIKKFIFYSTVGVYGNHKAFTTEATTPEPANDYGESKLAAEKTISRWVNEDSTRQALIIRPTIVFGPQNFANMYNLIDNIYKKRFLFVGRGDNIKSVAYVENLVDATVYLLERLKPGVDVYNYVDYPQMTVKQIVETITGYLSYPMPRWRIPLWPAVAAASIFDLLAKITGFNFPITANRIKKFNTATHHKADKIKELGFKPKVDLSEGFKRMVEWYLGNGR